MNGKQVDFEQTEQALFQLLTQTLVVYADLIGWKPEEVVDVLAENFPHEFQIPELDVPE